MDLTKLYKNVKGPLQEAKELELNNLYITEDGSRIRYLGEEDGSMAFVIEKSSPLVDGVKMSELSVERKGGLPMFWKFMSKDEDTSND